MHTVLGTPYYIAPEVILGDYDEKCDVWSIGVIAYVMLFGHPPFEGSSTKDIFEQILSKKINFDSLLKSFSADAVDFLRICITRDPKQRSSAQNALNHPWFNKIRQEIHSAKHLHKEVLDNLKDFSAPTELKLVFLKFLVNNLNQEGLKKIKETFVAMDAQQDGYLNISELTQGFEKVGIEMSDDEVRRIFTSIDFDGNGKISCTQFAIAAMKKDCFVNKDSLTVTFDHFDFDCSGSIDKTDLEKALLSMGQQFLEKDALEKMIKEETMEKEQLSLSEFLCLFGI